MKHTFWGKTGRAQLTVVDASTEGSAALPGGAAHEYHVRLLPRSANRSTAYTTAGDLAYAGTNLDTALMHIRAWTGINESEIPIDLRRYLAQRKQAH